VHNFKTMKAQQPDSFQIDPTQEDCQKSIKQLKEVHRMTLNNFSQQGQQYMAKVYLPADYPDSVAKEYLQFTIL